MLTDVENKILEKLSKVSLANRKEIEKFLINECGIQDNVSNIFESATKSLKEKGLISAINPVGSTCFVITRRGTKIVNS